MNMNLYFYCLSLYQSYFSDIIPLLKSICLGAEGGWFSDVVIILHYSFLQQIPYHLHIFKFKLLSDRNLLWKIKKFYNKK